MTYKLEWKKVKISDVSEIVSTKTNTINVPLSSYVSTENLVADFGGIITPKSMPNTSNVISFLKNDILFSNIRTYFKKLWFADFDGGCSSDVLVFRPKNQDIDNKFLYYVLKDNRFINHTVMTSKGTKMPRGDKSSIRNYEFLLPDKLIQKQISAFLSKFDYKIELLKNMNVTLESIAQTIFKSWFIDFDPVHAKAEGRQPEGIDAKTAALFPDSFEESELGLVPEGWKVRPIGDVVKIVGGGTPSTKEPIFWCPEEYHWVTPKDLSKNASLILLNTERKISTKGLSKVCSGLLPAGTLLMSSRAPIGYLAITKIPTAINQGFIAIPPHTELSSAFLLLWCQQNMETIKQKANGSTFMEISKTTFRIIKIIYPTINISMKFNKICEVLFEKIAENERQRQTLIAIRDTLLPRLISGQLQLPDELIKESSK